MDGYLCFNFEIDMSTLLTKRLSLAWCICLCSRHLAVFLSLVVVTRIYKECRIYKEHTIPIPFRFIVTFILCHSQKKSQQN